MRVLYVIDSLIPGGAEQSLADLAPRYVQRGVKLDVAYLWERPGLHDQLRDAGARLFCLAGRGGRAGWITRIAHLIPRLRPDLIHTTLFEADIAGRIAGRLRRVPVVSSLVNVVYGPEQLAAGNLRRWKVRAARLTDAGTARMLVRVHAVSSYVADVMSARLSIPRERLDVVPRGRDPDRLGIRTSERRAQIRAALGLDTTDPLILAVGRQEYQKGFDVLLEAMPHVRGRVSGARLLVAGREGDHTAELTQTVRRLRLGDAVRFLGNRSDVPDLLSAADIFVFPSRWEGLPGSVLEAMALEAPIVASDIAPVREVVEDARCAMLVEPGRPDLLGDAIVSTLAQPRAAAERALRARARFLESYTLDAATEGMLGFYDRALTLHRR